MTTDIDRTALVDFAGLARTYGAGATACVAVHDASGSVHRGDHIAVMGPSGSGKTTLLHLIAGLDRPTAGHLAWPAIGSHDELRPGPVGVVFQAPSLLPPLDALENVALPLLLAGVEPTEATSRAAAALGELDLDALSAKLPEELSGGQAQRVAIARILATQPLLILADEPTGQLDQTSGGQAIDALIDVARRSHAGLVVNTHDPVVAERLAIRWSMIDGHLDTAVTACSP